jgi:iron(II)-dependent oxidoreductase
MSRLSDLQALTHMLLWCVVCSAMTGCSDPASQSTGWQLDELCKGSAPCLDMAVELDVPPDAEVNADLTSSDMSLDDMAPDHGFELPEGMALVPEGPFLMGISEDFHRFPERGLRFGEAPEHEVYLSTYAMDIYEVRVKDYQRCVEQGPCSEPRGQEHHMACNWGVAGLDEHPINCVDWFQAQAYCQWLDKSLPTEAQLEKAARGPNSTIYPWGNEPETSCEYAIMVEVLRDERSGEITVRNGCGMERTWPVGSRPKGASVYDIMDLIGNVQEWPSEFYDMNYYRVSEYRDPQGPATGQFHAPRGGSWLSSPSLAPYGAMRFGAIPTERATTTVGFRCVKNL